MKNFSKLNIDTNGRSSGKLKTFCPQCRHSRSDKRDKPLSVDLSSGLFLCHHCGWKGNATEKENDFQSHYRYPQYATLQGTKPPTQQKPAVSSDTEHSNLPHNRETPGTLTKEHFAWLTETRGISEHILSEMKISSATQYMPQTQKQESCISFPFLENGIEVNAKFRTTDKHFRLAQGAELIPYNIDGIKNAKECIITEGELDALSFMAAGHKNVISVPNGANPNLSWLDRFINSHLDDKRVIYLATDADRKGMELQRELMRRLGTERCRLVDFTPGCKDANEQLLAHGAHSLSPSLEFARCNPLEGVFTAKDIKKDLLWLRENGLGAGADTGLEPLDACCKFETGRVCVVTGVPGCGKSEFVDELVLRLCLRHGWKAAFFSPENFPLAYHIRKLIEKLTGRNFRNETIDDETCNRAIRFLSDNVTSILPKEDFSADTILRTARELVTRKGIRQLVIDPFNRLDHQIPPGQTETQYISSFIDRLTNFAQRNDCLVIVVAHPRKMNREPGQTNYPVPSLYDINGSAAFFNKCDFGMTVERDYEKLVTRVHVGKVKFRHLGTPDTATFVYNVLNGRYTPLPNEQIGSAVKFDNETWIDSEDYVG